jgi:plastocyanin
MFAAGLVSGCFSEEPTGAGPDDIECSVDIASLNLSGVVVAMHNFEFKPRDIRVQRGTRVNWVNCEPTNVEPHTTTADNGRWNSPSMFARAVFSQDFNEVGRFPYHCIPHASFMRGEVIVE